MQPPVGLGVEGSLAAGLAFPAPPAQPPTTAAFRGTPAPGLSVPSPRPGGPRLLPTCQTSGLSLRAQVSQPWGGAAEDPRQEACATDLA